MTDSPESAAFTLAYGRITIGTLTRTGGGWAFEYGDEFRRNPRLRPLAGFPDPDSAYRSPRLWASFAVRIPSLKNPVILKLIRDEGIDAEDQVGLLRRFGSRSIADPFILAETSR